MDALRRPEDDELRQAAARTYLLRASVEYAAAVFDAQFRIDGRGMIEMIEMIDEIILDGLRTVVERPPNQDRPPPRDSE